MLGYIYTMYCIVLIIITLYYVYYIYRVNRLVYAYYVLYRRYMITLVKVIILVYIELRASVYRYNVYSLSNKPRYCDFVTIGSNMVYYSQRLGLIHDNSVNVRVFLQKFTNIILIRL